MKISKMTKFIGSAALALGMTLGFSSAADATSEYIFYVGGTPEGPSAENNVNWSATSPLVSTNFTGSIYLNGGGLFDVQYTENGVDFNDVAFDPWTSSASTGYQEVSYISFNNGTVTGGVFNIVDGDENSYSATIGAGGQLQNLNQDYFSLNNLTFEGAFSGSTFGGIDVSHFNDRGTFGMVEFRPTADSQRTAGYGRTEVSVIAPTPAAALAGLPMLGVLGMAYAIRRRRIMANA